MNKGIFERPEFTREQEMWISATLTHWVSKYSLANMSGKDVSMVEMITDISISMMPESFFDLMPDHLKPDNLEKK